MATSNTLTAPEFNMLFKSLLDLDKHLVSTGSNKHDRARLLISACIVGCIDNGTRIVGVLVKLGFDRKHVGITLTGGLQINPGWPNWGRRTDGTYHAPPDPTVSH